MPYIVTEEEAKELDTTHPELKLIIERIDRTLRDHLQALEKHTGELCEYRHSAYGESCAKRNRTLSFVFAGLVCSIIMQTLLLAVMIYKTPPKPEPLQVSVPTSQPSIEKYPKPALPESVQ